MFSLLLKEIIFIFYLILFYPEILSDAGWHMVYVFCNRSIVTSDLMDVFKSSITRQNKIQSICYGKQCYCCNKPEKRQSTSEIENTSLHWHDKKGHITCRYHTFDESKKHGSGTDAIRTQIQPLKPKRKQLI